MIHKDGRLFDRIFCLYISLPGESAFHIGGAAGDPADDFAMFVQHRVAVMGHTYAFFGELEADDDPCAGFLAGLEGIPADEPGLA